MFLTLTILELKICYFGPLFYLKVTWIFIALVFRTNFNPWTPSSTQYHEQYYKGKKY